MSVAVHEQLIRTSGFQVEDRVYPIDLQQAGELLSLEIGRLDIFGVVAHE